MRRTIPITVLLMGLLSACAGLAGEPEIRRTLEVPTPIPTRTAGLETQNDFLAQGAELFAQNCVDCHGEGGAGNGELVRNGSVNNPGNFAVPQHVLGRSPLTYHSIITNGVIQNLMPPWEDALTEMERWAVSMFTYTMHYTPEQVAQGQTLVGSATLPQKLLDINQMSVIPDDEIYRLLNAGEILPEWESWTEPERQAAVAYIRYRSLADIPERIVPFRQAEEEEAGMITGLVTNATQDAEVPDDLMVTLHIIDEAVGDETLLETTVDADGRYIFRDVPFRQGLFYFVTATHSGRSFATGLREPDLTTMLLELPLTIYEVTNDPESVRIVSIITQARAVGGQLEVFETIEYVNDTDRVFIAETDEERDESIKLELPPGATVIAIVNQLQDGQVTGDGSSFHIADDRTLPYVSYTRAVIPQVPQTIRLRYILPYSGDAVIEYALHHPFAGSFGILLETDRLSIESDWLQRLEDQLVDGEPVPFYGSNSPRQPGETIRYTVRGAARQVGTSVDSGVITTEWLPVAVGTGVALLAAIAGGLWLLTQQVRTTAAGNSDALINGLVRQIESLDAQHDAGEINHDVYQRRRQQLQERLDALVDASGQTDA